MGFLTKANLETHTHLYHLGPSSPPNIVEITPINGDEPVPDSQSGEEANEFTLIPLPIEDPVPKCPHCSVTLSPGDALKDHWMQHHEDVCPQCIPVFTSVYSPQLWKKVKEESYLSKSYPKKEPPSQEEPYEGDPCNADEGTSRESRAINESYPEEESPSKEDSHAEGLYPSYFSHSEDSPSKEDSYSSREGAKRPLEESNDAIERQHKRQRKQSRPQKVVSSDADAENVSVNGAEEESSSCQKKLIERKKKVIRYRCMKCVSKPQFRTFKTLDMLRRHKRIRHNLVLKKRKENGVRAREKQPLQEEQQTFPEEHRTLPEKYRTFPEEKRPLPEN